MAKKKGLSYNKTWQSYNAMKQRCYNQNIERYPHYGGRGITVCDRWRKCYRNFLEDMGDKPEGMTLDRIDNNGNYCKENCRWATMQEQANNKSTNRLISIGGVIKTLSQWIQQTNIKPSTVRQRFYGYGWSIEKSLGIGG